MKNRAPWVFLLGAALLFGSNCERKTPDLADAPVPTSPEEGFFEEGQWGVAGFLTGMVTLGHEVRSFQLCGAEEEFWVLDESGILGRLHAEFAPGQDPYEGVFMALTGTVEPPQEDGFGADYPGTFLVSEVQYAGKEGLGCDSNWTGFLYRAYGNEPFWDAELSEMALRFHRLGEEEFFWDSIRVEEFGSAATVRGFGSGMDPIQVDFLPEPCRDSMSGAYSAFTALVQMGGERFRGCAVQGQRGQIPQ